MILVGAISPVWYWVIVIGYMFVLIGIGAWTYRYQKRQSATDEHDDYWISKRRNSALVVGCAIAAGWFLMGFITWAMYNTYMYGIGGIFAMVVPWTVLLFCMVDPGAPGAALQGHLATADAPAAVRPGAPRRGQPVQHVLLHHLGGRRDLDRLALHRTGVRRRALGAVLRLRGAGRPLHGDGRLPRGHQRQPAAVRDGRHVRHHPLHHHDRRRPGTTCPRARACTTSSAA